MSSIPPSVACVLARGETAHLCAHPRALPPTINAPLADFVVVPIAFAWLYPDSMFVVDALAAARRGLILHGPLGAFGHEPHSLVSRLLSICRELRLEVSLRHADGAVVDVATASSLLLRGELVLRAERPS